MSTAPTSLWHHLMSVCDAKMGAWHAQVGKKKTQDVQFYTEVMEVNQAIDAGRRSMYDPDELEEEQRERETRNRVSAHRAQKRFT